MQWGDLRAGALSFVAAIALCAPDAWSADRAGKQHRPPAWYPAPSCNDYAVRDRIAAEFGPRYWTSGLAADAIRAREASWESWPQDLIPRRFCAGTVRAPYDIERPIYYAIIADGASYWLEWCIVGLDRAWAYNPHCRLARP